MVHVCLYEKDGVVIKEYSVASQQEAEVRLIKLAEQLGIEIEIDKLRCQMFAYSDWDDDYYEEEEDDYYDEEEDEEDGWW